MSDHQPIDLSQYETIEATHEGQVILFLLRPAYAGGEDKMMIIVDALGERVIEEVESVQDELRYSIEINGLTFPDNLGFHVWEGRILDIVDSCGTDYSEFARFDGTWRPATTDDLKRFACFKEIN